MYKSGDDLRQDSLVLDIIKVKSISRQKSFLRGILYCLRMKRCYGHVCIKIIFRAIKSGFIILIQGVR